MKQLQKQSSTRQTHASTYANRAHLADAFLSEIVSLYEGTALGRQEIDGEIVEEISGALWSWGLIEAARISIRPDLERIVIAVDPPITAGPNADECGIIVAGKMASAGEDQGLVIADLSVGGLSPLDWGKRVVSAYHSFEADCIVIEVNQGGDMVETVLRQIDNNLSIRPVRATKSKGLRAEPIVALYEQARIRHYGTFTKLEDQMTSYIPGSSHSPDRLDALVWALTDLLLSQRCDPKFHII